MKPALLIIGSSFLFATLGLFAALCMAWFSLKKNAPQSPNIEHLMFVALPLGGAFIGWLGAFIVTPLKTVK
jgi:hypothetical protein